MKNVGLFILLAVVAFVIYKAVTSSKADSAETKTISQLPASIQHAVSQMDSLSQNAFFGEFDKKRRKLAPAYLLWLIGCHYLYLRKVGLFIAYFLTGGGFGVWAIVDLFRMPGIVRASNEESARTALTTLAVANQFRITQGTQQPFQAPKDLTALNLAPTDPELPS